MLEEALNIIYRHGCAFVLLGDTEFYIGEEVEIRKLSPMQLLELVESMQEFYKTLFCPKKLSP